MHACTIRLRFGLWESSVPRLHAEGARAIAPAALYVDAGAAVIFAAFRSDAVVIQMMDHQLHSVEASVQLTKRLGTESRLPSEEASS